MIALLNARQLFFTRTDTFQDDYEGSVTRGTWLRLSQNPGLAAQLREARIGFKQMVYASCWHMNNGESEAMWRLYCPTNSGVALQTTYERLDRSLPTQGVFLGKVSYVDYHDEAGATEESIPNALSALMHKRSAFAHEQEVRAVIWPAAAGLVEFLKEGEVPRREEPRRVIGVPWDINETIEHIWVCPYAEEWYKDVVKTVLQRFAPDILDRLKWSQMKGVPLY